MTANITSLQSMVDATRNGVRSAVDTIIYKTPVITATDGSCARPGCTNGRQPKGRFCSDSCRAKAWHAAHYVKVKPKPPYDGPRCWCGNPAPKFNDNGRPKCGNHCNERRALKAMIRKKVKILAGSGDLESQLKNLCAVIERLGRMEESGVASTGQIPNRFEGAACDSSTV